MRYSLLHCEGWHCFEAMQAAVPAAGLGVRIVIRQDVPLRLGGLHLDAARPLDASVCRPAPGAHQFVASLNQTSATETLATASSPAILNHLNTCQQAYTAGLVSFNTKKYWKQFFEDELGPLPELLYAQVFNSCPA